MMSKTKRPRLLVVLALVMKRSECHSTVDQRTLHLVDMRSGFPVSLIRVVQTEGQQKRKEGDKYSNGVWLSDGICPFRGGKSSLEKDEQWCARERREKRSECTGPMPVQQCPDAEQICTVFNHDVSSSFLSLRVTDSGALRQSVRDSAPASICVVERDPQTKCTHTQTLSLSLSLHTALTLHSPLSLMLRRNSMAMNEF